MLTEQPPLSRFESAGDESRGGAGWFRKGLEPFSGRAVVGNHHLNAERLFLGSAGS